MNAMRPTDFLQSFAKRLRDKAALPKNIEISRLGPVTLASAFDAKPEQAISESVFSGMDPDPSIAVLKALVERLERNAFFDGHHLGDSSCQTERSDGFAAFPKGISGNTESLARKNALNEAVERYVWASWWDSSDYRHSTQEHSNLSQLPASMTLLFHLNKIVPIRTVYEIRPEIQNFPDAIVTIFFVFLRDGGVVSGGACEPPAEVERARFRALSELTRHALAFHRMKARDLAPKGFYEQRLFHFAGSTSGADLAMKRIQARGHNKLSLPQLAIDSAVSHTHGDLVAVHRCLFEGQPTFVGGKLERLCL